MIGDTQMQDMGAIITAQPSGTAVGLPPTQRSFLEIARESTVTCYEDTKTLFRAPLKFVRGWVQGAGEQVGITIRKPSRPPSSM